MACVYNREVSKYKRARAARKSGNRPRAISRSQLNKHNNGAARVAAATPAAATVPAAIAALDAAAHTAALGTAATTIATTSSASLPVASAASASAAAGLTIPAYASKAAATTEPSEPALVATTRDRVLAKLGDARRGRAARRGEFESALAALIGVPTYSVFFEVSQYSRRRRLQAGDVTIGPSLVVLCTIDVAAGKSIADGMGRALEAMALDELSTALGVTVIAKSQVTVVVSISTANAPSVPPWSRIEDWTPESASWIDELATPCAACGLFWALSASLGCFSSVGLTAPTRAAPRRGRRRSTMRTRRGQTPSPHLWP